MNELLERIERQLMEGVERHVARRRARRRAPVAAVLVGRLLLLASVASAVTAWAEKASQSGRATSSARRAEMASWSTCADLIAPRFPAGRAW